MTPEDLDRLHAEAIAHGVPAEKLNALREAALGKVGSLEAMARSARIKKSLDEFLMMIRDSNWPS